MSMRKLLSVSACIVVTLLVLNTTANATSGRTKDHDATSQLSTINERLNQLGQQNAAIQGMLAGQSKEVASLKVDQGHVMQQLLTEQTRLEAVQRQLAEKEGKDRAFAIRNNIATCLNLFGMILGVLGGVLLAGSQLSARQEHISDIRVKSGFMDLGTQDTRKEMILNFFGLLGSSFLAVGFVFQFIGALVGAPLSWFAVAALSLIAIALVIWIFWYFLTFTPGQTSADKVKVVMSNVRRHIIQPIWSSMFRRRVVTCQTCLKKITSADAKVWWVHEDNVSQHPYLHMPREFHYGHETCLPKTREYLVYLRAPDKQHQVRRASVKDFWEKEIPKLREWFAGWHQHWAGKPSGDGDAPGEEQLKLVEKDISPLMTQ